LTLSIELESKFRTLQEKIVETSAWRENRL